MDKHRYLQKQAHRSFITSEGGTVKQFISEEDIRLEAAFRCWLRNLNLTDTLPTELPNESELNSLAVQFDSEFGVNEWWDWPIWSSCKLCNEKECVDCNECYVMSTFSD